MNLRESRIFCKFCRRFVSRANKLRVVESGESGESSRVHVVLVGLLFLVGEKAISKSMNSAYFRHPHFFRRFPCLQHTLFWFVTTTECAAAHRNPTRPKIVIPPPKLLPTQKPLPKCTAFQMPSPWTLRPRWISSPETHLPSPSH